MKLTLVKSKTETKDVKSFFFARPARVNFLPGQFAYLTLNKLVNTKKPTRIFTISSSPTENSFIQFTTRIRQESEFKKHLDKLTKGSMLDFEGPSGTFIIDEKEKGPHILIAGGIGITPFRSTLKYAYDNNLVHKYHLIYSNKTPSSVIFRKEIDKWTKKPGIDSTLTITRPKESKINWNGRVGRIDNKLINDITKKYTKPTFWICGPPKMVDSIEKMLLASHINSSKIRTERFSGY